MFPTRRSLLLGSTIGLLAGCTGTNAGLPAQILGYASSAVAGLQKVMPGLAAVAPQYLPAPVVASLNSILGQASAALGTITTQTSAAQGASTLQQVETYLNAVLAALAAVPLIPPPYNIAIQAAAILVPTIEAWINSVLPAAPTPAKASPAMARLRALTPQVMTPDQAKAILDAVK